MIRIFEWSYRSTLFCFEGPKIQRPAPLARGLQPKLERIKQVRSLSHPFKSDADFVQFKIYTMDESVLDDLSLFGPNPISNLSEGEETQLRDAGVPATSPTSSPTTRRASPSFYEPFEWNIPQFSPVGNELINYDKKISNVRNESNLVNAVHMHVQDNARIPNYNHPVDRSNSSTNKLFPRRKYTSERFIEPDNSMAELFLSSESSYRKSLNQTYEVRGSVEEINIEKDIDELAAVSVDPTPWSEIKDKIDNEEETEKFHQHQQIEQHQQQQKQLPVASPALVARISKPPSAVVNHAHLSSYYRHDRHNQLLLPKQATSPQQSSSLRNDARVQEDSRMAEAVATAAAIARSNNDAANAIKNNSNTSPAKESRRSNARGVGTSTMQPIQMVNQTGMQVDGSYTHQSEQYAGVAKTAASNGHLQRQRRNATAPPHAAAHAVSRASVLAATNRKSQYGFGGNHSVPSVPAPPSIRSSTQPILQQKLVWKSNKANMLPSSTKQNVPVSRRQPTVPNGKSSTIHIESNSGSAYERKKQKAKDARVKLNESIERLAIAVSLAGSESKHRIGQLENQIDITEFRQKSVAVSNEGIKLAENAKKWDRPSFVGTAASIIQSLNAQCEALMAELIAIQKLLNASKSNNGDTDTDKKTKSDFSSDIDAVDEVSSINNTNAQVSESKADKAESPTSDQMLKRHQQSVDLVNKIQSPNKRPRLGIQENRILPSNNEVIFRSIAGMLDPLSLCCCACTNKIWREMNAFKDEKIWFNLAVKRFGIYNVRKWSENLKDGECEEISNKEIYEEMNASNVMPHFTQEGLSFLGKGRIPGKLSGWVFIVERSNGETLRSVKRDPNSGTSGGVGYQSRPVVELRIVIQNTGMANQVVTLKSQQIGVDVSTRRRGGEFEEIDWDDRFKKVVRNLDGTMRKISNETSNTDSRDDLCRLNLFETAVFEVHINARGCSTISKFRQRSNFTKILASLDGTTVPMVVPFLKHDGMI